MHMSLCFVVCTGDVQQQHSVFYICVTLQLCHYVTSVNQALLYVFNLITFFSLSKEIEIQITISFIMVRQS